MPNTLANTAARIAVLALKRDASAAHQCFRIKNLHRDEVEQFVIAWSNLRHSEGLEKVRLVVADDHGGLIPKEYVASEGYSITHYRNNNPDGLVYIETGVQSDAQGLQNMFSLQDINYLDGSFDDYAENNYGVSGLLISEAWKLVAGNDKVPPLLLSKLKLVLELVHPSTDVVPVRRFISFIEQACSEWISQSRVLGEAETEFLVGNSLWLMGMFPDAYWKTGAVESRWKRRLNLNSRHSELIDGTSEIEPDVIASKAKLVKFIDDKGNSYSDAESNEWRDLCIQYGVKQDPEIRRQIPYFIFSQLFEKDTTGLRLGDRVRAEIEAQNPDRLVEYDSLDVITGLNARSSHDANRLIEAQPPKNLNSLVDLLTLPTRKTIERLAAPPRRRFFNPAIELVRLAQRVFSDNSEQTVSRIILDLGRDDAKGSPTHGLFVFLFGETLKSIASNLDGVVGGCKFEIANDVLEPQEIPKLINEYEDDELTEVSWDPLPLKFTIKNEKDQTIDVIDQMEWFSNHIENFALFWLLALDSDSPALSSVSSLNIPSSQDVSDWLGSVVGREWGLDIFKLDSNRASDDESDLIQDFKDARFDLRRQISSKGIEIELLRSYLDIWQSILLRARVELSPDGIRSKKLDSFLSCDFLIVEGSDRRFMLPFHPLRLRWIARYLDESKILAEKFLSGEATFAGGDGDYYLNWLEKLTPRETPPIAIGEQGQLLYSRSEVAWCEEFSPLISDTGDVGFDSEVISSITSRISNYLDSHPYKRDGLSLLIILPTSDDMPAEILKRIGSRGSNSIRVSLYVAAPRKRWEGISRCVEKISSGEEGAPRMRLFPDSDLTFIDYKSGDSIAEKIEELQLDIAVVSHILQEQIVSQPNTEPPTQRSGAFDPLRHRPLRMESGVNESSISLVMLPKYPDSVLESWSTLVVRANRSRSVAPGQPENTDFVELRVNFQDSARLFNDLHTHCHWVITIERHIAREQIESIEAGSPDVLSIEEGIGANRLNTIIVSSKSGRELIQTRLIRKLKRLLPSNSDLGSKSEVLSNISRGIYESSRQLSPKLTLEALGVARVTEEILGLTVARNLSESIYPATLKNGIVAWLSLDEHTDWFGGHGKIRADMCRLTFERCEDGSIEMDILILEGKLRQLYDGYGVQQVKRTSDFFQSILGFSDSFDARKVDAPMWLELIASAVECLSKGAITVINSKVSSSLTDDLEVKNFTLTAFRAGEVRLRSVKGVYSACLWDKEDSRLERTEEGGVTVLKSTRHHLVELVSVKNIHELNNVEIHSQVIPLTTTPPSEFEVVSKQVIDPIENSQKTSISPNVKVESIKRQGMDAKDLDHFYNVILSCLASHGVSVSPASIAEVPYVEGPASILFKVRPNSGIDPRKVSDRGPALKIALELEQEQNISFNIDRGFVTIDVPKRADQRYFVDAKQTWQRWEKPSDALTIPIGEDRYGELVAINFSSSNSPHLLVAGTTGSGKSEALNTILFGLTKHYSFRELRLLLVDPKGTELAPFKESKYLEGEIGFEDQDALKLLKLGVEEMQRRYVLFREAGKRSLVEFNSQIEEKDRLPWWLIVLDEYADLTHDPQFKKEIESELKRLAQKARAAGIHVIIATQKPDAQVISTNLRSNLPAQLALKVKSAIESRVVIDESGAENLNGKGDSLLKADGRLIRVQCSRVDPADWDDALAGPI